MSTDTILQHMKAGRIICTGDALWWVSPQQKMLVIDIPVGSSGRGEAIVSTVADILVEEVTGYCSDSEGLAACRFGWQNDANRSPDFFATQGTTSAAYPVASTVLTDAGATAVRKWNLVIPANTDRTYIAVNERGTPSYTLSVTLHVRTLTKLDVNPKAIGL